VTGSRTESYSYDLNGNRTGTGYSTTVMNETATSPGVTYTYDNAGNMISANNGSTITTYTYDYRNRLTEVTTGGSVVATYTYNALDQRIGVKDSGTQTWTVYNGKSADAEPYADFNGSDTLTERYLFGPGVVNGAVVDEILARTSSGGTTAWYLPDKLGSVRDIVSTSGSELDHVVYDSFGNIVTETSATNGDRFKFAGMEYDSSTSEYYDRARDYDSIVGRFFSQDPKGFTAGDSDLYRYAGNEPINLIDPSGLEDQPWFPGILIVGPNFQVPNLPMIRPFYIPENEKLGIFPVAEPGSMRKADALVLPGLGLIKIGTGTVTLVSYNPVTKTYTLIVKTGIGTRFYPRGKGNPFRRNIPPVRVGDPDPIKENNLPPGPGISLTPDVRRPSNPPTTMAAPKVPANVSPPVAAPPGASVN